MNDFTANLVYFALRDLPEMQDCKEFKEAKEKFFRNKMPQEQLAEQQTDHLSRILGLAYDRSMKGKGRERHGHGKPFHKQPIMDYTEKVGMGFPLGQALKKIEEFEAIKNLKGIDEARKELLDAIVYLCAAYLFTERK